MVVIGSLTLGLRIATNMRGRLSALRQVERILCYIEGELKVRQARLGEALTDVSLKTPNPYSYWLSQLADMLESCTICAEVQSEEYAYHMDNVLGDVSEYAASDDMKASHILKGNTIEYKDFYTLWCKSLTTLRDETQLSFKDITSLYDVGKALGYLDIESQQMNLALERERLHSVILELDKDLNSRMKNAVVMSFLCGLLTVIALL